MVIHFNLGNLIITELEGSPLNLDEKKAQEVNSGNVCFSNVPFYAGWFPPPHSFSALQTFCTMSRERIVSCYRQSCWHLLLFLFIRSSFLVFISLSNFGSC